MLVTIAMLVPICKYNGHTINSNDNYNTMAVATILTLGIAIGTTAI